jgi:hypothetical protein
MSRTANSLILGVVAALIPAVAQPQGTEKSSSDDRFIYDQVDEGILRLDSRSGEVSLCSRQENVGWACRIVADERRAVDGEIGRLERENSEMRKLLAERGLAPPGASAGSAETAARAAQPHATPERPAQGQSGEQKPTALQSGLDRTMAVAETIWRRLVEMMANVKADLQRRT